MSQNFNGMTKLKDLLLEDIEINWEDHIDFSTIGNTPPAETLPSLESFLGISTSPQNESEGLSSYKNHVSPSFGKCFKSLPQDIQKLATEKYKLFSKNPNDPSLQFKRITDYPKFCSVRVNQKYRSVGFFDKKADGMHIVWIFIGSHNDYVGQLEKLKR